ncbi:hypothetical protein LUU34_00933500 [Aix galericulata]|nr:hypothetical protein LUU34_00933500 [Aix galericulata]
MKLTFQMIKTNLLFGMNRNSAGLIWMNQKKRVNLHHLLQQDFLKFPRLLHLGLEAHLVPLSTCSPEEQQEAEPVTSMF